MPSGARSPRGPPRTVPAKQESSQKQRSLRRRSSRGAYSRSPRRSEPPGPVRPSPRSSAAPAPAARGTAGRRGPGPPLRRSGTGFASAGSSRSGAHTSARRCSSRPGQGLVEVGGVVPRWSAYRKPPRPRVQVARPVLAARLNVEEPAGQGSAPPRTSTRPPAAT